MGAIRSLLRHLDHFAGHKRSTARGRGSRRTRRRLEHFQNRAHLRSDVVERQGVHQTLVTEAVTAEEFVAILTLWCTYRPVWDVLQSLELADQEGWFPSKDAAFYQYLSDTVADLDSQGDDVTAGKLLKVGSAAAELDHEEDWRKQYQQQICRRLSRRIADQPYLHQRSS